MRIERHIFGSVDGYRTLAHSEGLTTADCEALEGFAFGTPYDPAVRASFAKRSAYWSRPLRNARRAITQVRLGDPDDAGRPTLLFLTAIISAEDWDETLQGDARPLLANKRLWQWTRGSTVSPLEHAADGVEAPAASAERLRIALGILSLVEMGWGTGRALVVREGECELDDVMAVERLLPSEIRERFSVVYRALNGDMRVSLACLAEGVASEASNPARTPMGPVSPYAKRLVQAGILEGRDVGRVVRTYNSFAETVVEEFGEMGEEGEMDANDAASSAGRGRGTLIFLMAVLAAFVGGGATGWFLRRPPPAAPNPWPGMVERFLRTPTAVGESQIAALREFMQDISAGGGNADAATISQVEAAIAERVEDARLVQEADAAIRAARPGDKPSMESADRAVRAIKERAPSIGDFWGRLWDERRSGLTPAPDRLAKLMKELYTEAQSLSAAPPRGSAVVDAERIADAQSLMAAITLNAKIDRTLRDTEYDNAIGALGQFVKRMNDANVAGERGTRPVQNDHDGLVEIERRVKSLVKAMNHAATTQAGDESLKAIVASCRSLASACDTVDEFRQFSEPLELLAGVISRAGLHPTTGPGSIVSTDIGLWSAFDRCAAAAIELRQATKPQDVKKARTEFELSLKDLKKKVLEKNPPFRTSPP